MNLLIKTIIVIAILLIILLLVIITLYYTTLEAKKEMINLSNILPGSIFGCTYGGKLSKMVSSWTRSKYNHVGIYLGENIIVEVLDKGITVRETKVSEWMTRNNIVVREYKGKIDLKEVIFDNIISHNKDKTKKFSLIKWAPLIFSADISGDNETYCSKFICTILKEGGIIKDMNNYLTPGLLLLCENEEMSQHYSSSREL